MDQTLIERLEYIEASLEVAMTAIKSMKQEIRKQERPQAAPYIDRAKMLQSSAEAVARRQAFINKRINKNQ